MIVCMAPRCTQTQECICIHTAHIHSRACSHCAHTHTHTHIQLCIYDLLTRIHTHSNAFTTCSHACTHSNTFTTCSHAHNHACNCALHSPDTPGSGHSSATVSNLVRQTHLAVGYSLTRLRVFICHKAQCGLNRLTWGW